MELAPRMDHAVLFSGDGDFKPLVESLQRQGVRVSVVSTIRSQPPMIADELRRQADNFIELDDLREVIGRPPREPRTDPRPDPRFEGRFDSRTSTVPPPPSSVVPSPARRRAFGRRHGERSGEVTFGPAALRARPAGAGVCMCGRFTAAGMPVTCSGSLRRRKMSELPPLTLYLAAPRGFCAGVDRAIKIVEMALASGGRPSSCGTRSSTTSSWSTTSGQGGCVRRGTGRMPR